MKNTPTLVLDRNISFPSLSTFNPPASHVRRTMYTIDRGAEARLVETLTDLREDCESWTVVVFHLDKLLEEYRSDYQLKIATNLVNDLLRSYEGAVFSLKSGAVAVMCNHLGAILRNKLIFQLRYLYMDDPLAYAESGAENENFCSTFLLHEQWRECMEYATRAMMRASRAEREPALTGPATRFSAVKLAEAERELSRIDIQPALRRQPVCAVMPNGAIRPVFEEVYVNIRHVRELLKIKGDMASNKPLFKYFTGLLDERVLLLLRNQKAAYLAQPISVNVNVETLLSQAFTEFDAGLTSAQKVAVVFEVPLNDVFADMKAFEAARKTVQQKGYRLCIDGVTEESFPHLDRAQLGADLLKLQWSADIDADSKASGKAKLAAAIRNGGAGRVILCRCDSKDAVEYGQSLGISLFQGRYLDGLLNPRALVEN